MEASSIKSKLWGLILTLLLLFNLAGCVKPVPLDGITLSLSELVLELDETGELAVLFTPEDATDKDVRWYTNNPDVATVIGGIVTPVAPGQAIIEAVAKDGQLVASCLVTVEEPYISVSEIVLNKDNIALGLDNTEVLQAVVSPENATDPALTWSSSDESVAAVDASGEVTAVAPGTATITASSRDGITASCTVTVTAKVTGVSLNHSSGVVLAGKTWQLSATVLPEKAADKTVSWKSSNSQVATVSAAGLVTAKKPGTVVITAETRDGGKTAVSKVTVYDNTRGNTNGNIVNGGRVAYANKVTYRTVNNSVAWGTEEGDWTYVTVSADAIDPAGNFDYLNVVGGWIYYRNEADRDRIYRIRTDGTGRQKLSNDSVNSLIVAGGWIYYSNDSDKGKIYRMLTSGSGRERLTTQFGRDISVEGPWLVYINGVSIYRINIDGTDQRKLNDDSAYRVVVSDSWVYYTLNGPGGAGKIMRIKTDGSGGKEVVYKYNVTSINVLGGWIAYSNEDIIVFLGAKKITSEHGYTVQNGFMGRTIYFADQSVYYNYNGYDYRWNIYSHNKVTVN